MSSAKSNGTLLGRRPLNFPKLQTVPRQLACQPRLTQSTTEKKCLHGSRKNFIVICVKHTRMQNDLYFKREMPDQIFLL